jgi:hypothetical protein
MIWSKKALTGKLDLRNVRNSYDTLKDYAEMSMVPTQLRRTLISVLNKFDDRRTLNIDDAGVVTKGKQGADSIFTALEQTGKEEFARNLADTLRTLNLGDNFALRQHNKKL